jgi:hypothetical protein
MSLSSVGRALNWSSDGPGSNHGGFNPRLALKQAAKCWYHTKENIFHKSLSSVGRAMNSSSDGPGSNLGGFNPLLALKQASKCFYHNEENIFHNALNLVGRALDSSSVVRVQTSVDSIFGWF